MRVETMSLSTLSDAELLHFAEHIAIPEIGVEGLERLKNSKVLVIGVGGLGCTAALNLATAGVGVIGLVDFDVVEESNLTRQVLYDMRSVGRPKVEAAHARLAAINPHVVVEEHDCAIAKHNALAILGRYDVIVDGVDSFETRYVINDACHALEKPTVHGSVSGFEGQASVFRPRQGPCYRCLYPGPPAPDVLPYRSAGPILGPVAALIGAIQAVEAIKLMLGLGDPLVGRLLMCDTLTMRLMRLAVTRDEACPLCGPRSSSRRGTARKEALTIAN